MTMSTAQEILSQQDVFLALQQKRLSKQAEASQVMQKLTQSVNGAFSPMPRATNRMDFAMQLARNAFSIWQGVSLGLKIVRGFRAAFKK